MSNSVTALGEGIAAAADLNFRSEISTGANLLGLMTTFLTLSSSWSTQLEDDQTAYQAALYQTIDPTDPQAAGEASAAAAAAYAQYTNDEASQSKETGTIRTLMNNLQSVLRNEASSMETIYDMGLPVGTLETWVSGLLRS